MAPAIELCRAIVFSKRSQEGMQHLAWASTRAILSSPYVWPRPPVLRCQRDQAGLLDLAAPATPTALISWRFSPLFCFEGLQPIGDFGSAELAGPAIPKHSCIEIAAHTA